MDDPIIQNRIFSLPPAYQEFVMSDFISSASFDLAETGNLEEASRVVLSNGLLLYMLYFLDRNNLVSFLTDNGFILEQANAMVDAFISILPEEFSENHDTLVSEFTDDTEPAVGAIDSSLTQNPDGTNTYSSSQSSVLQQKNSDDARWGQI